MWAIFGKSRVRQEIPLVTWDKLYQHFAPVHFYAMPSNLYSDRAYLDSDSGRSAVHGFEGNV